MGMSRLSDLVSFFLVKCGLECCGKEKIRCPLPSPTLGPRLLIFLLTHSLLSVRDTTKNPSLEEWEDGIR